MSTLSPQDIKTLEQTRQRLSQLTNSLLSLQQQILNSDPLPPWSSFHTASQVISQNLSNVTELLDTHAPLLSSLVAYPLPTYPGREQENILHALLRKKLEPNVEDWVEQGRTAGVQVTAHDSNRAREIREVWEWAGMAANEEARRHDWDEAEFTLEEREGGVENVLTGLRGRMGERSESESEDGGEGGGKGEEGDKVEPMRVEDVLRCMAKGEEVKT